MFTNAICRIRRSRAGYTSIHVPSISSVPNTNRRTRVPVTTHSVTFIRISRENGNYHHGHDRRPLPQFVGEVTIKHDRCGRGKSNIARIDRASRVVESPHQSSILRIPPRCSRGHRLSVGSIHLHTCRCHARRLGSHGPPRFIASSSD